MFFAISAIFLCSGRLAIVIAVIYIVVIGIIIATIIIVIISHDHQHPIVTFVFFL